MNDQVSASTRVGDVIDSLGEAGRSAPQAFWSLVVVCITSLIVACGCMWLLFNQFDASHKRYDALVDAVRISQKRQADLSQQYVNTILKDRPRRTDDEEREFLRSQIELMSQTMRETKELAAKQTEMVRQMADRQQSVISQYRNVLNQQMSQEQGVPRGSGR